MMKLSKKFTMSLVLMFLCFVIGGCMEKETPDVSIKACCEAFLYRDPVSLKSLNRTPDEMDRSFLRGFVPAFIQSSGFIFSDDQARRVGTALMNNLRKVSVVRTEVIAKNGKQASVRVTLNSLRMDSIKQQALEADIAKQASPWMTQDQLIEITAQSLIKHVGQLEPSSTSTFSVDCTYKDDQGKWMPDNMENFGQELIAAAIGM